MAYTPCESAKVQANATKDCINPATAGLKMLAVAVAFNDIASVVRGTGATKNVITAITLKEDATTFAIEASGETPWASTTESFDAATKRYNKTVTFVAPTHGAGFSAQVVEPLMSNSDGYVIFLQRKQTELENAAYPVIGLERGAVGATAEMDYTDTATGGSHTLALTETGAASSEIDTTAEVFAQLLAATY